LFFDGNGYGAEAALRRLLIPARALHLDLIVFNYYDRGQPRPSMQEMRGICDALYDRAATVPTPAGHRVYIGGHSLGATFALFTAADRPVTGVFLAAPVTTGVAMLHHQLPVTRLVWLRPDDDYRQFNNLSLAQSVHAPTVVFGSDGDEALPPTFTHAVYAALPSTIVKQEVILSGVPHSEYFAQEIFWRHVSAFFALPVTGPLVGYIR
jgi:predicted alpha/beta hydrolase family esterase